jgi:alpha-beta hydrolase superfamily lysophospholipase
MTTRCGPLDAEITDPESDKFTASMVLVPGLWERAASWRRFAGYLSHRGWRCIAVERRIAAEADVATHLRDLQAAIATLAAPPVVVGHDLGAVLALHSAEHARAVVSLAPLIGPPLAALPAALAQAGSWLARLRGAPLRPPAGRWRLAYPLRDMAEPALLVRDVLAGTLPLPAAVGERPCAIFAGERDEVVPIAAARALAQHVGCELESFPEAAHALLQAPGWEAHVAAVHRWLVRHLGVDLLALYDEAMAPE